MVKRCFQADAFPLVSAQEINRWCAQKTNDMIGHILDAIPQEAKLVLVNAVYFKGTWKFSFDRQQTKEEDFASSRGKLRVPMMFQVPPFVKRSKENTHLILLRNVMTSCIMRRKVSSK